LLEHLCEVNNPWAGAILPSHCATTTRACTNLGVWSWPPRHFSNSHGCQIYCLQKIARVVPSIGQGEWIAHPAANVAVTLEYKWEPYLEIQIKIVYGVWFFLRRK
jgi:hypothetical protein